MPFILPLARIGPSLLFIFGAALSQAQIIPEPAPLTNIAVRLRGEDWPRFLGPTGDGKSTETGIRTDWSEDSLRVVWQIPLQESYGACSVSKGRAYQFDRQNGRGTLLCLASETGRELWRYQYDYEYRDLYGYNAGPRTSPLVDGDRVYLYGVDGTLICVGAADGKLLWTVDTARQFGVVQNFFGVGSNPVVWDDLLIVMVGGSPPASQNVGPGQLDRVKGNGSGVVAFDKRTGRVVYQLTDELASYASLKITEMQGRPWCFAFLRGGLAAFDPRQGRLDFEFPWRARILESVNASVPVAFSDYVFISETYGPGSALLRCKPGAFEVVWQDAERSRRQAMQTHWNTAIHHDDYLYGCSGRHQRNAELRCIEALTGKVMWSQPGLSRTSLLYVDGHLVCLGEDGVLRLIRAAPARYDEVSQVQLSGADGQPLLRPPAWAAPVLAHGLLYVRGVDRLVCIELIPTSDA